MIAWYDRIGNRIEMKLYEDADKPDFEWVKGNVIEGYRYRDGIVSMKSDDGRIIWCGVESGGFRKSEDSLGDFISNADCIRSMIDEELTEIILCPYDTAGKPAHIMPCVRDGNIQELVSPEYCKKCMMDWLQSEVEE